MPTDLQRAEVYSGPHGILVVPMDQTEDGLWVSGQLIRRCDSSADDAALGIIAFQALGDGRRRIPRITDWKALTAPLLAAFRERSWIGVQRKYRSVGVERSGESVKVTPSRNGGTRGDDKGFHRLAEGEVVVAAPVTPESLGSAIRVALSQCV